MGLFVVGSEDVFPVDTTERSIGFFLVCILFCTAMIGFAMALSTFFTDPEVAV